MTTSRPGLLLFFVTLVVGGGLGIGYFTIPGEWYAQLRKPSFTPPGWLFPPVWTALYVLIAVAGWRVSRDDAGGSPVKLWWAQLLLNFLWAPVFFIGHQTGLAFAIIVILLATILTFISVAWPSDRIAAWLFVPYAVWVAFASILNGYIFFAN
jgi:tryptophan-rich sensory protein